MKREWWTGHGRVRAQTEAKCLKEKKKSLKADLSSALGRRRMADREERLLIRRDKS